MLLNTSRHCPSQLLNLPYSHCSIVQRCCCFLLFFLYAKSSWPRLSLFFIYILQLNEQFVCFDCIVILYSLSLFSLSLSLSLSLTSIYVRNGAFLCLLMASSSLQLGSLLLACWQSFKVNTHTHKLSGSAPSRPNLSIIHVSVLFSLPTFSLPRSSSSSFPIDVLNFPLCLLVYLWYSTFFLLFFPHTTLLLTILCSLLAALYWNNQDAHGFRA